MKKIYLFKMFLMAFVLMLLGGVNASAKVETVEFDFSTGSKNDFGWDYTAKGNATAGINKAATVKEITLTPTLNDKDKAALVGSGLRMYASSSLDISVSNGYVIKSIVFTKISDSKWTAPTSNPNGYNNKTLTWSSTSETKSVTFSFSGQCRIGKISVTYEPATTKTLIDLYPEGTAEDIYVGDAFTHNGIKIIAKFLN